MPLPVIAVTMGDPAGVGPEICLRLLADPSLREICVPIVVGDPEVLSQCAKATGLPAPPQVALTKPGNHGGIPPVGAAVLAVEGFDRTDFQPGIVSARTGAAGFSYVEAAIDLALRKVVDAMTTAPLNKEALHAAGVEFPGHTEILAARTGASRACMLQYSEEVRASFVTVHVGYHEVPRLLTVERILDVIELTADAMWKLRRPNPKLGVLGLNPHAGEHGLFGNGEEERVITPAIEAARAKGLDVEGPIPPDTAFLPERRRSTDAFICMYHDQGHIPLKALAFDSAVNTTLGLPIVRTSVDHGTACDIAWQGKANPGSLFAAVRLAAKLAS